MDMAFSSKGKAARFRIQSAVADPGEGLGGPAPPPPIFLDQLRPEGRKKFFLDPPPPPVPPSEGLDPPVVCREKCTGVPLPWTCLYI